MFIVNSKLSKTNFPHLWAFSILSPSYHPFTTASLILTRLKTFHKYCILALFSPSKPINHQWIQSQVPPCQTGGVFGFPTFFLLLPQKNEKIFHPSRPSFHHHFHHVWGTLIGSKESKKLRQPPGHGSQLWTSSQLAAFWDPPNSLVRVVMSPLPKKMPRGWVNHGGDSDTVVFWMNYICILCILPPENF